MYSLFSSEKIFFLLSAGICLLFGIGLKTFYAPSHLIIPWIALFIIAIVFCQIKLKCTLKIDIYWLWIIIAILLNISVLFFAHAQAGTLRTIGNEHFYIRVSLWSLMCVIAFLSQLVSQNNISTKTLIFSTALISFYYFTLTLIPETYTAILLTLLLVGFARIAHNKLRYALIGLSLIGGGIFIILVFDSYHSMSIYNSWLHPQQDPTGVGFILSQTKEIFTNAGWWGVRTISENNLLIKNPDFELFTLPLLSYWKGNLITIIITIIFFILTLHLYKKSSQLVGIKRTFIHATLALWVINHTIAIGAPLGLFPYIGHYGIAFLSVSDMTIIGCILIFTKHNNERSICHNR